MPDVVDKQTRSRMMSGIRGKNTRPELALRHALHRMGFRYRLHARELPGKPDLVLPKYRAVVFVHGCFWHRHAGCRYTTTPGTRQEFWIPKFARTVEHDAEVMRELERAGWRVAVVWECAMRRLPVDQVAGEVGNWLRSVSAFFEIADPESGGTSTRQEMDG